MQAIDGNEPLRVMHVVHGLGKAGRTGGMEYGVIKLANAVDRARVRPAICSTRRADPEIAKLVAPDVPVYECDGREGNDPRLVLWLRRVFRQFGPHIVHTHAWGTLCEGWSAARLASVPLIIHGEHGTIQDRLYQRWVQRFMWNRVDQVLSVSSQLAARLSNEVGFDPRRIRTIRNGVSLERFGRVSRAQARRALGLSDDCVAIGTVGRLVEVKDHRTLLASFERVAREEPRTLLLLAGDGPLGPSLRAQAEAMKLDGRVRFLGHRADIEQVLAALDVFVLSSHSEGLSNTILEAMASGVPVVATRVGGADELVVHDQTGLLVPARNQEALAAAMSRLTSSIDTRRRMGAASRHRAHAEFSLARMVRNYEELYAGLARRLSAGAAVAGSFSGATR
jgi:sugar transferase (PEP-CTERM/EpsH1 system associated)